MCIKKNIKNKPCILTHYQDVLALSTLKDMVCVLTPYQNMLFALKNIKWLGNCSGKRLLSVKLLNMAVLFLTTSCSLMHRFFFLFLNFFNTQLQKIANFVFLPSITMVLNKCLKKKIFYEHNFLLALFRWIN